MSFLASWVYGSSQLDEAVDKATSELLPSGQEDIALNLEICDQIRSKSVPAKDAMRALKRRLNHKNPNVQMLALALTDICIKNGGELFLIEVASREFMDNLVSILKIPGLNVEVKNLILRFVQNWSLSFDGKPSLSYVNQIYKTLKSEGYNFPPIDIAAANAAMVDTQTAPEWIDSDVCLRCRTTFSFTNRKHHCRNCGQVFDQACSSKNMALPHFGITQEVRVCDSCHIKLSKNKHGLGGPDPRVNTHPHGYPGQSHRRAQSMNPSRHRSAREHADAELQRAIQLSLEEAGMANGSGHARPGYVPSQPSWEYSEPPIVDSYSRPSDSKHDEEEDPDLRAAIEASLREANAPRPSAPLAMETPRTEEQGFSYGNQTMYSQSYPPQSTPHPAIPSIPTYDLGPMETDAILTFSQTVEQVQETGDRDMSRYPAVGELYNKANSLRPKLAMTLDDAGRKQQVLSEMHEKLSQAVKLYDHLLTEQVTQPRWSAQPPANAYHSTIYNNVYQQQQQQQQPVYAPQQTQSPPPQQAYAPYQPQVARSTPASADQSAMQQQQWYSPPASQAQYQPPPPAPNPSLISQQPMGAPVQPQQMASQPQYAPPPPPPTVVTATPPAPQTNYSAPVSQYQYPASQPQQAYAPPPPVVATTPAPTSHPSVYRQNTLTSPPPPQQQYSATYASPPPPAQQTQYAPQPPQQQQQQQPQQPQHQYTLSQFPVAPTSAPQTFPMYGQTVLPPVQTEQQEAALIEL